MLISCFENERTEKLHPEKEAFAVQKNTRMTKCVCVGHRYVHTSVCVFAAAAAVELILFIHLWVGCLGDAFF